MYQRAALCDFVIFEPLLFIVRNDDRRRSFIRERGWISEFLSSERERENDAAAVALLFSRDAQVALLRRKKVYNCRRFRGVLNSAGVFVSEAHGLWETTTTWDCAEGERDKKR